MLGELLSFCVLVALTAATFLLCFEKWGWLRAWEVHRPLGIKRCDFCAGFWLSVLLSLVATVLLDLPWWWVGAAFPAAAVCRLVVNFSSD